MELDGRPVTAAELGALGLYNYAHFTTMRMADGAVRGLDLHLERLVRDCRALHGTDLDPGRVRALIRRAGAAGSSMVRVTVFDPALDLGRPGRAARPEVLVTTRPAASGTLPPLALTTTAYERDRPQIKHGGLFAAMAHRRDAQLAGFDDVLFTDRHGRISEGATWNIAFLCGDALVLPEADVLRGVTMRLVVDALRGEGLSSTTEPVRDLSRMDAAFVTNAAVGLRPVRSIDGAALAPGHPVLARLERAYQQVQAETG